MEYDCLVGKESEASTFFGNVFLFVLRIILVVGDIDLLLTREFLFVSQTKSRADRS